MNLSVFWFTLKRHRVATILFFIVPVVVGVFTGVFFPQNQKDRELLAQVAKVFRKALDEEMILDVVTPAGFFNVAFQHPLTMLALVFAGAVPLISLPAGDRGRGTLDLLLATPLTRSRLVLSVTAAGCLATLLVGFAPLVGVSLGARLAGVEDRVPLEAFAKTSLNLVAMGWWFTSLATLVSVISPDGSSAMRRFGIVTFLAFSIQVAGQLWKGNTWIRSFGPFGWYRPSLVTAGKGSPLEDAMVLIGVAALFIVIAVILGRRRRRA